MFTDRLAMGLQGLGITAVGPALAIPPVASTPTGYNPSTGTVAATTCQDASGNTVDCSAGTAIYCSGNCDPNVAWAGIGVPSTTASLISDMQAGLNYFSSLLSGSSTPTTTPTTGTFAGLPTTTWVYLGVGLIALALMTQGGGRRR